MDAMTVNRPAPQCPSCGEPVAAAWTFCPACEAPLGRLQCPRCGEPLKANWVRCPACETRLVCRQCRQRLPAGSPVCPACGAPHDGAAVADRELSVGGIAFVLVPGGRFAMGDGFDEGLEDERLVHTVELDDFYLGRFPVTQEEWNRRMPGNPSRFPGDRHPVEQVNLEAVEAFIQRFREEVPGEVTPQLPSEAQWEYAARSGGRAERFAGGDDPESLAWFGENSGGRTRPVGLKQPNGLGLWDLSGNVWEWCRDTYRADAYHLHARRNPVCREHGADRVIRGGSWHLDAWSVRCARRLGYPAAHAGPALGFRLALVRTR
jgi:formylglycine-generating enzyme required for sulfatase activity